MIKASRDLRIPIPEVNEFRCGKFSWIKWRAFKEMVSLNSSCLNCIDFFLVIGCLRKLTAGFDTACSVGNGDLQHLVHYAINSFTF